MTVEIQPAVHGDLEALLGLLDELHAGGDRPPRPDGERARETWERILGQEGRTILIAEDGGRPVGAADVTVVSNLTHRAAPWAIVENVVVAGERRRQGIGRALMNAAVARARSAGCYKVQLLSLREREEAHEFYRALGFETLAEGFRLYFDERPSGAR